MSDIYLAAIVHMLHLLWWARNSLRFSSNSTTMHVIQVCVHCLIGTSGSLSSGKCIALDALLIDLFLVPHHNRQIREVVSVCKKAPTAFWVKVNTDGSVIGNHGAYGGFFLDHLGTFFGAFTCNLGSCSVFIVEVHGFILALEYVAQRRWSNIWLESDLTSTCLVFKNLSLVSVLLRNRWHNARSLVLQVISSHIFREGNYYVDRLAYMGTQ